MSRAGFRSSACLARPPEWSSIRRAHRGRLFPLSYRLPEGILQLFRPDEAGAAELDTIDPEFVGRRIGQTLNNQIGDLALC
jgi:hypothetical protein